MDMVDRTLAMVPQGALALHAAAFIDMIDRASAVMDRSLPVLSAGDSSPEPEADPTEGIAPQDSQTTALVVHSQGTIIVDPSQTPWELLEHIVTAITSDETPIEDIREHPGRTARYPHRPRSHSEDRSRYSVASRIGPVLKPPRATHERHGPQH